MTPGASPTAQSGRVSREGSATPSSVATTSTPVKPTPAPVTPTPSLAPRATPITGPLASVVVRGNPSSNVVALTFDAGGTDSSATVSLLDTLKSNRVRATMFMTGQWSESHPDLLKRIVDDGHELGNHTFTHPDLTKVSDEEVVVELTRTEALCKRLAGVSLGRNMRPPFGAYDDRVRHVLAAQGYSLIYWTLDSADWRPEFAAPEIASRVGEQAKAGDIVVFHLYPAKTAQALPAILKRLRERGLRPGSLGQVMG
ncbi:MAG: polysaccharide deacetylase family protein [Chloroflexi bacterium]|nr:polysaccharide deacetylase family protein [Chloroflexota bacterium]